MILIYRDIPRELNGIRNIEDFHSAAYIPSSDYFLLSGGRLIPNDTMLNEHSVVEIVPVRNTSQIDSLYRFVPVTECTKNEPSIRPETVKCNICGCRDSITYKRKLRGVGHISKIYFCEKCYIQSIEHSVMKMMRKYNMVEDGDSILFPLSGGKDGLMESYIINQYIKKYYVSVEQMAYTVVIHENEYTKRNLEKARLFCQQYNIKHYVIEVAPYVSSDTEKNCFVCSSIRREVERIVVSQLNISKLTTGINMSDRIRHKLFGTFLDANASRFVESKKIGEACQAISPILYLRDCDVAVYLKCAGIEYGSHYRAECPYASTSYRGMQTVVTNLVDDYFPGVIDHNISLESTMQMRVDMSHSSASQWLNYEKLREYITKVINDA